MAKTESFNWAEPPARLDPVPVRPFIGKAPGQMMFIDSAGQVFDFNPGDKHHPFTYRYTLTTDIHAK